MRGFLFFAAERGVMFPARALFPFSGRFWRLMRGRIEGALILAITIPAVAGCAKTSRDRLQGRWLGEAIERVPASQVAKATGWVRGAAIEFAGSKVTVTVPAETPRSGTYKVAREEGDQVTVVFSRAEGGHDEAKLRFVGEDELRWALPEGPEIRLVKAK
jgi:hypothetical protein